ncbi:unnamed protein product [Amaranthus hypochondriacus]
MGCNLNRNYFDLGELEKGGIATISAIFGSPSFESESVKGESLVDLKLGRSSDIGKGFTTSLMDPFAASAGSSKRPRTPSSSGQVVSCLVDGCKSDLSKCRDYHRRHKVCELHSKTPRVTIGGHEQRFCQQCSRFHALGEFDEGKRSCRKRLEGHNRRRRKPQPDPLPVNPGSFISTTNQGSRLMAFNQPIIPASSIVSTTWSGAVKTESNQTLYSTSSSIPSSFSHAYRSRQFPFLQVPESPLPGVSLAGQTIHHDPNNNDGSSSNGNTNTQKSLFCNGLNQVLDSDRALSLLSSSSAETPEMGLGRMIHHPSPINPTRSMLPSLHYSNLTPPTQYAGPSQGHGLEGHPESSGLFSNLRNNNFCQDVFQNDTDPSPASGSHQTLSFTWE